MISRTGLRTLAVQCGASLVARSFSGDKKQLQVILKAAICAQRVVRNRRDLTVCDVHDHDGSTKSYSYMKNHEEPLHALDFVPAYEEISVDIAEGEARDIKLHDGSTLRIKKLHRNTFQPITSWHYPSSTRPRNAARF